MAFSSCEFLEENFVLLSNLGPNRCGTAILVKKSLCWSDLVTDPDGRLLSVKISDVSFIVVYAPSSQPGRISRRKLFCETLPAFVSGIKGSLVLLGDFNSVEDASERQLSSSTPTDWALKELKKGLNLIDVWPKLRGKEEGHTFHHFRGSSRIDRFFVNKQLEDACSSIVVVPTTFTDHFALVCIIQVLSESEPASRRPLKWKLNVSFLDEEEYRLTVLKFISNAEKLKLRSADIKRWWEEIFKPGIKKISLDYGRKRAALIRATRSFYQNCLLELSSSLQRDASFWDDFVDLKQKAKRWEEQTLMGIGVKSIVQDSIPDEQVSVFHCGQLNRHQKENKINRLVTDEGCVIEDPTTINKSIIFFFDFVLATKHSGEADKGRVFLDTIQPLDLSLFNLENAFSLPEFSTVVADSINNKSPGSDAIPYEFYKSFWISIGPIFTEMCNKVLQDGGLCESQGSADIRLVPKCDAPQKLSDYRPISLLNSDYKLLSAAMSNRLKKSLPTLTFSRRKKAESQEEKSSTTWSYIAMSFSTLTTVQQVTFPQLLVSKKEQVHLEQSQVSIWKRLLTELTGRFYGK